MKDQKPLYEILRPKNLNEIFGNNKLKTLLKNWIKNEVVKSFILYGDPGCGKTSIINAFLNEVSNYYDLYKISGAMEGSKTLKNIIKSEKTLFSKPKILFVDEIHRLNKAEQDVLLLSVEKGEIILLGSTTENPAISINPALLSRVLTFKIEQLNKTDFQSLFEKIENYYNIKINNEIRNVLYNYSYDIRRIINIIEAVFESGIKDITIDSLTPFIDKINSYNTNDKYSYISAYIKSIRGSDPDAAILYLAYMLESGEDPIYIARRMVISASEDIGLSDPNALNIAISALNAVEKIGYPECYYALAQATIYLSVTSKSNSVGIAYNKAKKIIKEKNIKIPKHLINSINKNHKKQGFGIGYKYPHDFNGFVKQNYMPIGLENYVFYNPQKNAVEKKIEEKLKKLWENKKKYD
ncbi:hypothetical protein OSSY52_21470 [Tepiditoga spiralis]|uniref:AAA+ ATPase domain-containing protein n=1 Tax=Tepiditoga spiralis TaxID=2108365 RepID=A0A7G1G968_9BACT|nr:AAA family ATPase [Tepiditoga spiralis]BBE32006.1 hypothetical protein OSSY52_21470 [Tepiditoga spiralis]